MSMHWVYEWLQCVLDLVSNVLNSLSRAEIVEKKSWWVEKSVHLNNIFLI